MRTIIAGSRSIKNQEDRVYLSRRDGSIAVRLNAYDLVEDAILRSKFEISTVLSGTADGVDRMGELWALNNGIPLVFFPANWREHGKKAGFLRNTEMANNADALIAVWDGESPGTEMMIDLAKRRNLLIFVDVVDSQ